MYCVITKVSDDLDGNYACSPMLVSEKKAKEEKNIVGAGYYVDPPLKIVEDLIDMNKQPDLTEPKPDKIKKDYAVFVSTPVFRRGELLVLDHNGRDQFSRKPSKWNVEYDTFETIEGAIACIDRLRDVSGYVPEFPE